MQKNVSADPIADQLREAYEVEKAMATRLRNAPRHDRRALYSTLYDDFFQRFPDHPLRRIESKLPTQMGLLKRFLREEMTFLEIGPGDCSVSCEVAKMVRRVYAVDVHDKFPKVSTRPPNFKLILSDGVTIPVARESVDIAYSDQLMEHLHPDDALEQLQSIYGALRPGGLYLCITPNRTTGPHDVSRCFDDEIAVGFHLKEYTYAELSSLFKEIGFVDITAYLGARGRYVRAPVFLPIFFEKLINMLPRAVRRSLVGVLPIRPLLAIRLVGKKKHL